LGPSPAHINPEEIVADIKDISYALALTLGILGAGSSHFIWFVRAARTAVQAAAGGSVALPATMLQGRGQKMLFSLILGLGAGFLITLFGSYESWGMTMWVLMSFLAGYTLDSWTKVIGKFV
jgi:hypothetical protein